MRRLFWWWRWFPAAMIASAHWVSSNLPTGPNPVPHHVAFSTATLVACGTLFWWASVHDARARMQLHCEEADAVLTRAERRHRDALAGRRGVVEQAFAMADEPEDDGLGVPDHQIIAWTPAEREAFGINDTIRFIDATEKTLRAIEEARPGPKVWHQNAVNGAIAAANAPALKALSAEA